METVKTNQKTIIAGVDVTKYRDEYLNFYGKAPSPSKLFEVALNSAETREDLIRFRDEYSSHFDLYRDYHPWLLNPSGDKKKDTLNWFELQINPKPVSEIFD